MPTFLNLHPEFFAIDIGDLSVKVMKLQKRRKGFKIASYNEVAVAPGIVEEGVIKDTDALAELIKKACQTVHGKKINTPYVIASLPEEKSFYQVIQMPIMNEADLRSAVPFEAENYIPLPIDKVYLDFHVIGTDASKKHYELLINAMPRPIVDTYVECLKKAGLRPYALEVESQSVTRALLQKGEEVAPIIFMDIGLTKTSFIVWSNHSIRFTASFPFSLHELTQALSKGSKARKSVSSPADPLVGELVAEIQKYLNFYYNHLLSRSSDAKKIEKIILCGRGARVKQFPELLQKQLNMPVEARMPLDDAKLHSFTTAFGLALRGILESDAYPFTRHTHD